MDFSALSQRVVGSSKLYFKKNGPAILTGVGVVGFVGTTVLVARATIKAKPVIDDIRHGLTAIENQEIDGSYTRKQQANDYGRAIVDATKDLTRIYGPSVLLGATSITCIISAHGMLKKQNAALVAAYGALDFGFKAYRQRVMDELGPEKERDIYRGVSGRLIEADEETGEACEIEQFADVIPSVYGRFFDETSRYWKKNAEYNLTFLISSQSYCNDVLNTRGHLFLNEVYDMLGFERTKTGQVVGWLKKGKGDGYVDFDIHNIASDISRAFVNGLERVVFLDFNCDGPIINSLD